MKILALDTSAKTATAAVVENDNILCRACVTTSLTHSQTLLPLCDSMLKSAGITLHDIDLFAVSSGPGSFTGLRIGIGAMKGMAQGLNKPCIGVSTLEALGCNYRGLHGVVCAVMDARCQQVYTATFQVSGGYPQRLTADEAVTIEELCGRLSVYDAPISFVGDGAVLCYNALKDRLPASLAPPQLRLQDAASVGFAAQQLLQNGGKLQEASELMPQYLRLPQAERELLQKTKGKNKDLTQNSER